LHVVQAYSATDSGGIPVVQKMSSEKPQKMVEILANPHRTFMGGRSFFKCVAAEGKQGRMQAAIRVLGMGAAMAEVS
jgi:hypothetical protein